MSGTTTNGKTARGASQNGADSLFASAFRRLLSVFGGRNGDSQLRETIEEIIEEFEESSSDDEQALPIGDDERVMLSNILNLRHLTSRRPLCSGRFPTDRVLARRPAARRRCSS